MQNWFVLCHGEQVSYVDTQNGAAGGVRSWDPPLTERGRLQAWIVGTAIRTEYSNVTRVLVSPSLRCVQTDIDVIVCIMPSSVAHDQMCGRGNGSPYISTRKV